MKSKFFEEVEDKPKLKKCSRKDCINPNVNNDGYLSTEEFGPDLRARDHLHSECKQCYRLQHRTGRETRTKKWRNKLCKLGYGQCLVCGITDMDVMNYHHFDPSDEKFREARGGRQDKKSLSMEQYVIDSILYISNYAYTDENIDVLKKCLLHVHPLCANCHAKFHSAAMRVLTGESYKKSKLSLYNIQEFETIYYPIWLREKGVDPNHPILKDWDWNENFKDHKQLQIDEDISVEESVEPHHIENFIK